MDDTILLAPSPPEWAPTAAGQLEIFLPDHAACERKAAALALSFVTKYPDRHLLIEPMIALAREELDHFAQVYALMRRQGIGLAERDRKDPYVNGILTALRHGRDERLLDRLVSSGLIEARGCERFSLLADQLSGDLALFYRGLARSEAAHHRIFMRLAERFFPPDQVDEARARLVQVERDAMLQVPIHPYLH